MKLTKLFLALGLLFGGAVSLFAIRTNVVIAPLQSVTATGALADLDARSYTRTGTVSVLIRNKAGTNPTLDVKLQTAGVPTVGQSITTTGETENELREGATTKVKLSAKFTQATAASIKYVDLFLKKQGTLAAGKLLTVTLETNNSGVPSGTVLGTAGTVDIDTEVATAYSWVRFTFATAVNLSASTVYHVTLAGDYTASASNNVVWRSTTVASGGNQSTHNNTSWTAVDTENQEFILQELVFTDLTGGAFAQVTTAASHQTVSYSLDGALSGFVRPYATIGGTDTPEFFVAALLNAEPRR